MIRRQRGAALLLVMAVLFALTAAAALAAIRPLARADGAAIAERQSLSLARDALRGQAMRRRCADRSQPLDALLACPEGATEGEAAASCPGVSRGWLPWRTLGVPPLRDASGTCLWIERSGLAVRVIAPGPPTGGQARGSDPARVLCPGNADASQYLDAGDAAVELVLDPAALTGMCP